MIDKDREAEDGHSCSHSHSCSISRSRSLLRAVSRSCSRPCSILRSRVQFGVYSRLCACIFARCVQFRGYAHAYLHARLCTKLDARAHSRAVCPGGGARLQPRESGGYSASASTSTCSTCTCTACYIVAPTRRYSASVASQPACHVCLIGHQLCLSWQAIFVSAPKVVCVCVNQKPRAQGHFILGIMDGELFARLKENGVSESTMSVLLEEDVSTRDTFTSLEREHLRKLAQKLSVNMP